MIKIAILGLGTVGTGVVKVVEANTAPIQHKLGQPLSVKTALVRKLRADPYQHLMTENFREIEHDGEIRVVVETIGGVEAAYEYTRRCLMAGKHVVTANKQLVAEHGCELLDLARKNHVNYLFEASVGGGIPVLHPLTQCMAANRVDEIYGILNGTTNFILTKMVKEGAGEGLRGGGPHGGRGGHRRQPQNLYSGGSGLWTSGGPGAGAHGGHYRH